MLNRMPQGWLPICLKRQIVGRQNINLKGNGLDTFKYFTLDQADIVPIIGKLANLGIIMKSITATEAQNNFGDLLMSVQSEPISITRNGKEKGVLLSAEEYKKIKVQILQSAITAGLESGKPTPLDMAEIKRKAREEMRLNDSA
jgi:antitoxin Phd